MESVKNKISQININEKELGIFSLIEENSFGTNKKLLTEEESNEILSNSTFKHFPSSSLVYSPNMELNKDLDGKEFAKEIKLMLNNKEVGVITNANIFYAKNTPTIFNNNPILENSQKILSISGEISIYDNKYKKVKVQLNNKIKKTNAKKITALIFNADPVNRAHERMLRWTIDKADLIVIFVVEGYSKNSLNFKTKRECFEYFIKTFLPYERIFPVYLEHIDLFSPRLEPSYECLLAKSFGANKLVIGENHQGLGLFYDNNLAHTAIDELTKKTGLELIVLPEFVFCNKCNVMVSTKSCPHGSHHHIKYRSSMIREMLHAGVIPPTVLLRKEITAKLLAKLHPNRFSNVQMIYDTLFPSNGIIEKRTDEDLYVELIKLHQTGMI